MKKLIETPCTSTTKLKKTDKHEKVNRIPLHLHNKSVPPMKSMHHSIRVGIRSTVVIIEGASPPPGRLRTFIMVLGQHSSFTQYHTVT